MTTWFISDLHLDTSRPVATRHLLQFLQTIQGQADALYILGDFFEYWIGDDVLDTPQGQAVKPVLQALQALSVSGVKVYFLHGNRDFLIGERFAAASGCELLPEQLVVDLYEEPTLIMHGDTLCTDDIAYQRARRLFRNPAWQADIMAKSIPERLQLARQLRIESQQSMQGKAEEILDVSQQAVEEAMREAGVKRLIHGHTHRPAVHEFVLDGELVQRIVLGDWYTQSSYLRVQAGSEPVLLAQPDAV